MKPVRLHWRCIDAAENKARWYSLTTAVDLWGNTIVIRRWGRIGGGQRERISWPADQVELRQILAETARCRRRRGYVSARHGNPTARRQGGA